MGAISDGSFKKYGFGSDEGQYDMNVAMRPATYGQVTKGEVITNTAVSVFLSLTQKFADGSFSIGRNDNTVSEDATPEEIKKRRDEILDGVSCSNAGDVETKILDANAQVDVKNQEIEDLNKTNESYTANNEKYAASKAGYQAKLNALDPNAENYAELKAGYEAKINELDEAIRANNEAIDANKRKIAEVLNPEIKNLQEVVIPNLEQTLTAVKKLDKQLIRAEGRDAVEKWNNDETQNIVKLIKKYNEYKSKGKLEKAEALKNGELKAAIEAFKKNPDLDNNPTINRMISVLYNN